MDSFGSFFLVSMSSFPMMDDFQVIAEESTVFDCGRILERIVELGRI